MQNKKLKKRERKKLFQSNNLVIYTHEANHITSYDIRYEDGISLICEVIFNVIGSFSFDLDLLLLVSKILITQCGNVNTFVRLTI